MLPGPIIILECSACGKHISEHTTRSGSTLGVRYWTDGKVDTPMLLEELWLVKCQRCNTLVWIDELKQVGRIATRGSRTRDANKFPVARPASTPTLQDYADFIKAGVSDKEKERYVRLRIWWAGNDSRREKGHSTPLDSFEAQNLRAFVTLLDEDNDDDRIMKAEALRELGEFAAAENLLATEFGDGLLQTVSIISDLNQKRIATVAEMVFQ